MRQLEVRESRRARVLYKIIIRSGLEEGFFLIWRPEEDFLIRLASQDLLLHSISISLFSYLVSNVGHVKIMM